jgi:site-specific DNA-methyltransferase (cytosine-N4-specific)
VYEHLRRLEQVAAAAGIPIVRVSAGNIRHDALDPGHRFGRAAGRICPRCAAVWADPQYGLEPTVEEYTARLVGVFDQVRRVLSPTGTCWLNLGDSYAGGPKRAYDTGGQLAASRRLPPVRNGAQLPAKNLIGVPWRVAFALQASGWWLFSGG